MTAQEIIEASTTDKGINVPVLAEHIDKVLVERDTLRPMAYHTAPGEMEFGGEGWTWKQQARADHDRLLAVEAERNKAQRDLEDVAMRLDELHAKIDALARKPEP